MRIVYKIIIGLSFLMLFQVLSAESQEEQRQDEWTGNLQDGKVLTNSSLKRILENHKKWLETDKKEGQRADLSGAILYEANLDKADLRGANLSNADLDETSFFRADLRKADLSETTLIDAELYKAKLSEINLRDATMLDVNLSGSDLQESILIGSDLRGADLKSANLREADLYEANLEKADLRGAILKGAELIETDMRESDLRGADFNEADLTSANLQEANLLNSSLRGAFLYETNLSDSYLHEADLTDAYLNGANLEGAIFQSKVDSIPKIKDIDYAQNLSNLTYKDRPQSLIALREEFKKGGMRKQEREITHAINHARMLKLWNDNDLFKKIEAAFNFVLFEITCQYGMKPGRPLIILLLLIPLFSLIYLFALKTKTQNTGIWLIFPKNRVLKTTNFERPFKLTVKFPARAWPTEWPLWLIVIIRSFRAIRIATYFSLIAATNIGWREFNVGNWIARLQRREYNLKATGWVRTISGIQSLSSVYLLALWVLTFFGRPFDAI